MLHIGLLSMICAVTLGVFGFGVDAPPIWTWQKIWFFIWLFLAVAAFAGSTISRPSLLWEFIDENRRKRYRQFLSVSDARTNGRSK